MTIYMLALLCNHIFAFVIASYYLINYFKKLILVQFDDTDNKPSRETLKSKNVEGTITIVFVGFSALFMTGIFVLIFLLPTILQNQFLLDIVSTGFHIPILIGFVGFIINKIIPDLHINTKKNAFLMVSIAINFNFIFLNWKIALLVLSIIIGKYVWVDFVFDMKDVVKYLKVFFTSKELCDVLIKTYCKTSVGIFVALTIFYNTVSSFITNNPNVSPDLALKYVQYTMFLAYFVIFIFYNIFLNSFNP